MSTVTASAPGRVNLIGEHLDYNGGLCLPIAIGLRTTAAVRRTSERDHVLRSALGTAGWERYLLGVLDALGVSQPLEIEISSDVPVGAGLSSSAALTCSTALAVDAILGLGRTREELVEACIRAENDHVGAPTGGMDQAAALFGTPGTALLLDIATGARTPVPFHPAADGVELLVVDTGVSHALADGEYARRRSECASAAAEIGVATLAQARYEDLARVTEEAVRRRARHVVTEQHRVLAFAGAAATGDWAEAGALMTASHLSLRDDFEVSCPELDVVVAEALAAGALGGRMTGGGFGGSAILLVDRDDVPAVGARVAAGFARNGWEAPTQFRVEASAGGAVLTT